MNELARMLRERSRSMAPRWDALGLRAADEIDRLEAELAACRHVKIGIAPIAGVVAEPTVPLLKRRGRPPKVR